MKIYIILTIKSDCYTDETSIHSVYSSRGKAENELPEDTGEWSSEIEEHEIN